MSDVLFERRDAVAWITINRPEARNVLGPRAFVELADAWEAVRHDSAIRVVEGPSRMTSISTIFDLLAATPPKAPKICSARLAALS